MFPPALSSQLTALLRQRAGEGLGIDADELLEQFLGEGCGFPDEQAAALVAGEACDLDEEALDVLAQELWLDGRLLLALACGACAEVLLHTLREVLWEFSGDEECEQCRALQDRAAEPPLEPEGLQQLAFDVLAHIESIEGNEPPEAEQRLQQFMTLFGELSPAGQHRILAALYEEQERELLGVASSFTPALAEFRCEQLNEQLRAVVDLLAEHEEGSLSVREIAAALELPVQRLGARLSRGFQSAYRQFGKTGGARLPVPPVTTSGAGATLRFELAPAYRRSLRAILLAERALGTLEGDEQA